jgi:hypothetical protein
LDRRHKLLGHLFSGRYKSLLERVSAKAGAYHYGEELRESAEASAQRIVAAELARRGWQEADLAARRKGDAAKVAIAQRLRRETTTCRQAGDAGVDRPAIRDGNQNSSGAPALLEALGE